MTRLLFLAALLYVAWRLSRKEPEPEPLIQADPYTEQLWLRTWPQGRMA